MARSSKPSFQVAVYGLAAEYDDIVPDAPDLECLFLRAEVDPATVPAGTPPAFVILDTDFLGESLERLLPELNALDPAPDIVAVTREPSTDEAVRLLRSGASDYCVLPRDRERLIERVDLRRRAWRQRKSVAREAEDRPHIPGFPDIIARCEAMEKALDVVRKVIDSGARTVLIRGETGTGKELIARAIHYRSTRADQPFIEVNCTAIPDALLEAELFGYEPGAFTDAKTTKKGLLQLADCGTLFLDEIGDMSLSLQAKLLRAIEEKRFRRLGGTAEIAVSMRIIGATGRDLEQAIERGLFRSDLYFRLNVVSVELPPLRARGRDVELLADHFATRCAEEYEKPRRPLSADARRALLSYAWPGNVRELKNAVERAVILGEGPVIEATDILPSSARRLASAGGEGERLVIDLPAGGLSLVEYERRILAHALGRHRGNRSRVARELGISRPRLLRKIEKYGLAGRAVSIQA